MNDRIELFEPETHKLAHLLPKREPGEGFRMPQSGPTVEEPEPWQLPQRVRVTQGEPETDGADRKKAAEARDDELDDATHDD